MEFASDDEKEKLALVAVVVPDGPEPIVVSGGVVSGGGGVPSDITENVCLFESVDPSPARTISFTYFVPALSKVKSILQPSRDCQTVLPSWFSNDHVQVSGGPPFDSVPSSVTGTST